MIIHWNLEVPASQVWIRGADPEALTATPRNLEDIQEDRRDSGTKIMLTVAFVPRGVGMGAGTTRSASKPRASKMVRPVEWSISLVGVLSPHLDCVYMCPGGARHNRFERASRPWVVTYTALGNFQTPPAESLVTSSLRLDSRRTRNTLFSYALSSETAD